MHVKTSAFAATSMKRQRCGNLPNCLGLLYLMFILCMATCRFNPLNVVMCLIEFLHACDLSILHVWKVT